MKEHPKKIFTTPTFNKAEQPNHIPEVGKMVELEEKFDKMWTWESETLLYKEYVWQFIKQNFVPKRSAVSSNEIHLEFIRERYTPPQPPICRICGSKTELYSLGADGATYYCSTIDYSNANNEDKKHFESSRVKLFALGDTDVLKLIDSYQDLQQQLSEANEQLESTKLALSKLQAEYLELDNRNENLCETINTQMIEYGKEVSELRKQLSELQSGLTTILSQVDFTMGCNGEKNVLEHAKTLAELYNKQKQQLSEARISTLEKCLGIINEESFQQDALKRIEELIAIQKEK